MASLWSKAAQDGSPPSKDNPDVADTGIADIGPLPSQSQTSIPMVRPQLQRNQLQPPPQYQPPPPPSSQQGNPTDSLSLMQLRRIVTDFPKIDPTSYAFTYADTATFEEEVDEWFSYNDAEFRRLHRAKDTFQRRWKKFAGKEWVDANQEERSKFMKQESNGLLATDLRRRCKSLQTILHVMLGVWHETAGRGEKSMESKGKEKETEKENNEGSNECAKPKPRAKATKSQLDNMKSGILLVAEADGIPHLFQVMQDAFNRLW
jgi:hypothetical protein